MGWPLAGSASLAFGRIRPSASLIYNLRRFAFESSSEAHFVFSYLARPHGPSAGGKNLTRR